MLFFMNVFVLFFTFQLKYKLQKLGILSALSCKSWREQLKRPVEQKGKLYTRAFLLDDCLTNFRKDSSLFSDKRNLQKSYPFHFCKFYISWSLV